MKGLNFLFTEVLKNHEKDGLADRTKVLAAAAETSKDGLADYRGDGLADYRGDGLADKTIKPTM